MENLISLVNKIQRACTALGDHGEESTLPTLWDSLPAIAVVGGQVKEAVYTRLCSTKSILTVNGKFPGPTIYTRRGETVCVKVYNKSKYNITLHWHGVKQPRYPWSDGPEYITQCPIQPGARFIQKVIFSVEEGTLRWHAHSDWARATVHGAIVVYPKRGSTYPFPRPNSDVLILLGEWWNRDVDDVYREFLASGGAPNVSDAYTINGQPGDLYPCSKAGTFRLFAFCGETILLRIINAAMNQIMFFSISNHPITVVASDASYTKPLTRTYIAISPGQTMDVLLQANQGPNRYYMAARTYSSGTGVAYDNTTTTAILQYYNVGYNFSHPPSLPTLPYYNDTIAALNFTTRLWSRNLRAYPHDLPLHVTTRMFSTVSVNALPCEAGRTCKGPNGTRLRSSMSNISFVLPRVDILEAYYYHLRGFFGRRFPYLPPLFFNFTAEYEPLVPEIPRLSTQVKILEYNETVEMVLQGTNLVAGIDHPMHLHG
ncbi:hypothetical protein Ancab_036198 [Ancistrocladus abbreviatus]